MIFERDLLWGKKSVKDTLLGKKSLFITDYVVLCVVRVNLGKKCLI